MSSEAMRAQVASRRLRGLVGRIARYLILVLVSLSFLLPIVWMISSSLQTMGQVYSIPPTLIPRPFRWANYPDALRYLPWLTYAYNTLVRYAVPTIIGVLLSSSLVAYGFARIRWRWRDTLFFICVATMMIPSQVTMVPLFIVYKKLGLINTFLPLVLGSFFGNPYFIFLLRQFFMTIPSELSDAARIDGCSELGMLVRIILPLAKPALAVIALFQFMGAAGDYMGPLIYLNRQENMVIAQALTEMNFGSNLSLTVNTYGYAMVISTLYSVPLIILFFLVQRTFIEGVALTGIKM